MSMSNESESGRPPRPPRTRDVVRAHVVLEDAKAMVIEAARLQTACRAWDKFHTKNKTLPPAFDARYANTMHRCTDELVDGAVSQIRKAVAANARRTPPPDLMVKVHNAHFTAYMALHSAKRMCDERRELAAAHTESTPEHDDAGSV